MNKRNTMGETTQKQYLLNAPLSNIGMPVLGLFEYGGAIPELLRAPLSNTGMPVLGLFENGGAHNPAAQNGFMAMGGLHKFATPCKNGGMCYEDGGSVEDGYMIEPEIYKKGGHWIPKNLKKGRCTPAPNPDCPVGSPQYNLAMTFKKHHGFHKKKEYGGSAEYDNGGYTNPWTAGTNWNQDLGYNPVTGAPTTTVNTTGQPMVTPSVANPQERMVPNAPMYPTQAQSQPMAQKRAGYPWGRIAANAATGILNTAMAVGAYANNMNNMRDTHRYSQQMGLTGMQGWVNGPGTKGDYNPNTGIFREQDMTPANNGYFAPAMGQYGGYIQGKEYELDDNTIEMLRKKGYKLQML